MQFQSTPGPWTACGQSGQYNNLRAIKGPDGKQVALLHFNGYKSNDDANARLIAAAPDLLLALRSLIDATRADIYTDDPDFVPALSNLSACVDAGLNAISKALVPTP
jgi:hypothetical protein